MNLEENKTMSQGWFGKGYGLGPCGRGMQRRGSHHGGYGRCGSWSQSRPGCGYGPGWYSVGYGTPSPQAMERQQALEARRAQLRAELSRLDILLEETPNPAMQNPKGVQPE